MVTDDQLLPDDVPGHVAWITGATLTVQRVIQVPFALYFVSVAGDVDLDGVEDLRVDDHDDAGRSYADLLSGRDGTRLARWVGP